MLPTTIIAQSVNIWDEILNYIGKVYNILDNKIGYFFDSYYTIM